MNPKLEKIIKKSGNNLHLEIVSVLESRGWEVEIQQYYYDDTTDKPREIDIIASKRTPIFVQSPESRIEIVGRPAEYGSFKSFLFIECKYFTKEVAFRMRKPEYAEKAIILEGFNKPEVLAEKLGNTEKHHYLNLPDIGKLYDSEDNATVFNAITQPVKSLVFFKERKTEKGFYYPVTVFDGIKGLIPIEGNDFSKLSSLPARDYMGVELGYSYRSVFSQQLNSEQFIVDFVHKNKFVDFIRAIEREGNTLCDYLKVQHEAAQFKKMIKR